MAGPDLNEGDTDVTAPETESSKPAKADGQLVDWVMEKVNRWREQRDSNYESDWQKYYRIWRGRWDPSLKLKQAERSKIITPATQSAVDQTVAEMAEAVFGRGMWFDLSDPPPPPQLPQLPPNATPQMQQALQAAQQKIPDYVSIEETIRDNLIADFSNSRLTDDVIETFYNGALYGSGISKRVVDTKLDGTKYVCWAPVAPNNFVIDTAATNIDEALGCAHETILPLHHVQDKQKSGEYYDDEEIDSATGFASSSLLQGSRLTDMLSIDPQDGVYFTEYHGKVPAKWMPGADGAEEDPNSDLMDDSDKPKSDKDDEYVEAVVCIGNGTVLLSAMPNELNDRGFIAYQHHRSPNSFWGIGVVEKAYNSQVGLDGEVRARMDALSLTTYPTVGVDATRMPRNLSMQVAPGKVYMTNGQPNEIIQPISFGGLNNASFQQSGDLERYVQVATGATDPAKPINGNSTASGQSQQSAAFIKRAKLTMQAVDVYLNELVRKSIIVYSKLNPQRYPKIPYFTVNSTMSIMAREFEQMQMTNLLAIVPQQSPAFPIILKGILESYSGPSKDKIIEAIDQSMKPDPAAQQAAQQQQQLTIQKLQAELAKTQAEAQEVGSRVGVNQAKAQTEQVKAKMAPLTAQIQAQQVQVSKQSADTQARQVEVDAAKAQIDHHHRNKDHEHKRVSNFLAMQKMHNDANAAKAAPPPATK